LSKTIVKKKAEKGENVIRERKIGEESEKGGVAGVGTGNNSRK